MGWYERFRDALHAKPPPREELPQGPSRVRDWWDSNACPCPPLTYVTDARAAGVSFAEYVRSHWIGDADLTPEDEAVMTEQLGETMAVMVDVMTAAEEQGVEWPDTPVPMP